MSGPLDHLAVPADVDLTALPGLEKLHTGKVREVYAWPGGDDVLLVATDRVSVFDVVLPTAVPGKGVVLGLLTAWWCRRLADVVGSHLGTGDDDVELAASPWAWHDWPLDGGADASRVLEALRGRALRCRRLDMLPVECVARGYLTGSAWADYQVDRTVSGVRLPPGLSDGDRLDEPVFTPSTKAPVGGHDRPMTFDDVVALVGGPTAEALRVTTLAVFRRASQVAADAGLLLADTKLEMGRDPRDGADGPLVLGDEVLTPDSSRFWDAQAWQDARQDDRTPPPFDKQLVRDHVRASGWHDGRPAPALPDDVVAATQRRYAEVLERLTGRGVEQHRDDLTGGAWAAC